MPAQLPSAWGADAWAQGAHTGKGGVVSHTRANGVKQSAAGSKAVGAGVVDNVASLDEVYANVMEALSEVNTSEAGDTVSEASLRSDRVPSAAVRAQREAEMAAQTA